MAAKKSSDSGPVIGTLMIIAAIQLVFFILIAQHIYPNYSLKNNFISDLGVGSTASIFNTSVAFFGLLLLPVSFLMWKEKRHRYASFVFLIAGIGGIGVGAFPETTGVYHLASAALAFGGIGLNAILFSRIFKGALSYYSLAAGILALFILFISPVLKINFGLGSGGMEEVLFYDEIIWALVVGMNFINNRI